jgi:L-serine dehydratase
MPERSSIFDMIGPVMIGPSSSHTAGVVRIGRAASAILGEIPDKAEIIFYNSFARTYEGHGSDRAIIAGLLNFQNDDKRIKEAFAHAKEFGLEYVFRSVGNASTHHPNTIKLNICKENRCVEVIGVSRGGGVIEIVEVNGFNASFSGGSNTLIITAQDKKGSIAFITNILANDDCNIATMTVSRRGKNQAASLIFEIDTELRPLSLEYIKALPWVEQVVYVPILS